MSKQPNLKSMKAALSAIANMDFGLSESEMVALSHADAVDMMVVLAKDTLNPVSKPSALEAKTAEVAKFVMGDFKMAFASNDEIGEALNTAGILSPNGKPWTRSNVSKIMHGVKDIIIAANTNASPPVEDSEPQADPNIQELKVPEPVTEPVTAEDEEPTAAVATAAPDAAQPAPEGEVSPEDELLAELDELDDLVTDAA